MVNKKKTVIVVAGPTAVGKTSVAIQLASHFQSEIISADSRQCFKELNIGVARPSAEELKLIPHHFIASHSITEEVTAAVFENYALAKLEALFQYQDVVVMVGGTGLYIKAFCEGLDAIPAIDPAIRENIIAHYKEKGLIWLQNQVKEKDALYAASGEMENPQRLMRALEVVEATGESILVFQKGEKTKRDFSIIKIGLQLPKEQLHERINNRVDQMIQNGLIAEVQGLLPFVHLNALQTVGYTEIFDYLNGEYSLPTAIELIKTHTRQYAKRQYTWFRKDTAMQWFEPNSYGSILAYINNCL